MISKIKEIYQYRELLWVFTKKELKIKYKNSAMGILWSFINPLIMTAVYSFVFLVVFKGGAIKDYPLFLIIGLLSWNFFTICIGISTGVIIANANLIKKVKFPREIIPLSVVFSSLINFMIEMSVLLILVIAMGYNFFPYIPILILAIVLQTIVTIGFAFIFCSLTVYFRDIEQLINIILLIWFFGTPIMYDLATIPGVFRQTLKINPLTSIILLYRESLYNLKWPSLTLLGYAIFTSFLFFTFGYLIFAKLSPNFAKEI